MSQVIGYVNDRMVDGSTASISVFDLGLIRGYGVFDRLRTYHGRPFHFADHLKRLQFSAEKIHLPLPKKIEEIKTIIEQLLIKSTAQGELDIRIIVTGGDSMDGLTLSGKSSLIILIAPFCPPPEKHYKEGIIAGTSTFSRSFPQCKTTQYLPAIVALERGKKSGAAEVLYLNEKNEILEGATSNFFGFKKGSLITAHGPEILSGITREIVLNLAKPFFSIEKRNLHLDEVSSLDEAFITSSNRGIVPVVQINNCTIGNRLPGKNTLFLREKFSEYTKKESWPDLMMF